MRKPNGLDVVQNFLDKADACWDEYIPTGFKKLDQAIGGGLSVGLTILGALSALGKTTLMEQIATGISERGRDVLFITLEMRKKQICAKAISRQSFLQGSKEIAFTSAELQKQEIIKSLDWQREQLYHNSCEVVQRQWSNFSLISKNEETWTVTEIEKYIQKEWVDQGYQPPVIFIDYLQLTPYEDQRETSEIQIIGNISSKLKALSTKLATPVMVISSINRASYNEPIGMSCFKGSGNIEFNADVLLGIQLAGVGDAKFDMEAEKRKEIRNVEIKVLKVKEGESGTTVPMDYYAKFNYFAESDREKNEIKKEWVPKDKGIKKPRSTRSSTKVDSKSSLTERRKLLAEALEKENQ